LILILKTRSKDRSLRQLLQVTNAQQRIFPDQAVSGVECAALRINLCGRFACEFRN
jgi:hypothetical protein